MTVNKVILVGRLGGDPELRSTQSGTSVANMSVATNRTYTTRGEKKEETEWHRVVVFGDQAESCDRYLSKGRRVYVEGRLQTDEWEDRDGNKRKTTEIVASTVQFLGGDSPGGNGRKPKQEPSRGNPARNGGGSGGGWPDEQGDDEPFDDDDIPF